MSVDNKCSISLIVILKKERKKNSNNRNKMCMVFLFSCKEFDFSLTDNSLIQPGTVQQYCSNVFASSTSTGLASAFHAANGFNQISSSFY